MTMGSSWSYPLTVSGFLISKLTKAVVTLNGNWKKTITNSDLDLIPPLALQLVIVMPPTVVENINVPSNNYEKTASLL